MPSPVKGGYKVSSFLAPPPGPNKAILVSTFVLDLNELAAIGSVAVESTYCEHVVEGIIWDLCRLKEAQGKFLTDRMLLDKRLDLMGDLWRPLLSDSEKSATLTRIVSGLKEANNERNLIIHGHWEMGASIAQIMGMSAKEAAKVRAVATKRRLKSDPVTFSAEKILQTAMRIAELTGELWDFAADAGIRQT